MSFLESGRIYPLCIIFESAKQLDLGCNPFLGIMLQNEMLSYRSCPRVKFKRPDHSNKLQ